MTFPLYSPPWLARDESIPYWLEKVREIDLCLLTTPLLTTYLLPPLITALLLPLITTSLPSVAYHPLLEKVFTGGTKGPFVRPTNTIMIRSCSAYR
jgi:hypothetical protein